MIIGQAQHTQLRQGVEFAGEDSNGVVRQPQFLEVNTGRQGGFLVDWSGGSGSGSVGGGGGGGGGSCFLPSESGVDE